MKKDNKTTLSIIKGIIVIAVIVYGVSPVDLIADIAPVLGYVDDIAVAVAGIAALFGLRQKK